MLLTGWLAGWALLLNPFLVELLSVLKNCPSGRNKVIWIELNWIVLNWTGLNRTELNWMSGYGAAVLLVHTSNQHHSHLLHYSVWGALTAAQSVESHLGWVDEQHEGGCRVNNAQQKVLLMISTRLSSRTQSDRSHRGKPLAHWKPYRHPTNTSINNVLTREARVHCCHLLVGQRGGGRGNIDQSSHWCWSPHKHPSKWLFGDLEAFCIDAQMEINSSFFRLQHILASACEGVISSEMYIFRKQL